MKSTEGDLARPRRQRRGGTSDGPTTARSTARRHSLHLAAAAAAAGRRTQGAELIDQGGCRHRTCHLPRARPPGTANPTTLRRFAENHRTSHPPSGRARHVPDKPVEMLEEVGLGRSRFCCAASIYRPHTPRRARVLVDQCPAAPAVASGSRARGSSMLNAHRLGRAGRRSAGRIPWSERSFHRAKRPISSAWSPSCALPETSALAWELVVADTPASTRRRRVRSPGSARSACPLGASRPSEGRRALFAGSASSEEYIATLDTDRSAPSDPVPLLAAMTTPTRVRHPPRRHDLARVASPRCSRPGAAPAGRACRT